MHIKEFFYFQKSDRQVLLVLLAVIIVALIVFFTVGERNETTRLIASDSTSMRRDAPFQSSQTRYYQRHGGQSRPVYQGDAATAERFPFDPNTADSSQLLRLGLRPWQVRSIYKYRNMGGVFRSPADFARLYGLTVKQYRELEPYIRISPDYLPASTLYAQENTAGKNTAAGRTDSLRYPVKLKAGEQVALCQADTSELKRVPGIGSGYARAIVRYGKRLGGYVSVQQLREIEGFPEEALPYFSLGTPEVSKINVNRSSLSQLRSHPYMGYYRAKAIIDYRRLHGDLKSLEELQLLKDFPAEAIRRLEPYVEY